MLSRVTIRATQTPALRQFLALGIPASSVWIRSYARHNRPNHNNNPNQHQNQINNRDNRGGGNLKGSGSAPVKPAAPGVAFTPSHPGARGGERAGRIDLSKGQVQGLGPGQNDFIKGAPLKRNDFSRLDDEKSSYPASKKEQASSFPEDQHEFKSAHTSENEVPESEIDPAHAEAQRRALPDLRFGIPSTLEYEAAGTPLNLTESEDPASPGGRGKGELPASAYISSSDKKRARVANIMYAIFAGTAAMGVLYLGRNWDDAAEELSHPDAPSGWALGLMWNRAKARLGDQLNYYNEPAFQKLLPPQDPPFERPYTLCISLEDMLVHSEWTREHGWRMAKRPGVDYFLRYLSNYYELVIFTSQPFQMAEPVIRKLDPFHIAQWPLYREATYYENGEYVKDLSYLNRDVSKVILIDTVAAHAKKQPDNAIILPKWKGDVNDKELVSLIPFLEFLCVMGVPDVRTVIKSFDGYHVATEFARREAIARAKFEAQLAEERKKTPKVSGLGALSGALGIKPAGMLDGQHRLGEGILKGKMIQDQAREDAIKHYQALEKEIRDNGEKWLKEEVANEKAMQAEGMKAMKSGFSGWFGVPPSTPPK